MARLNRDGSGAPPIRTLPQPGPIVAPTIGPMGGSLGLGDVKMQCLVMSMTTRAARAPSIHTVADPRNTSYIGT